MYVLSQQELYSVNGGGDSIWDSLTSNDYAYAAGQVVGYAVGATLVSAITAAEMIFDQ